MYLQSRTRRWLQTLRNANTQLHSAVAAVATFEAARDQGARVLGEQEHKVMTMLARDYIDLTLESQPLTPGSWLETTLRDVIQARDQFAYGDQFNDSLNKLINAVEIAMPLLEAHGTEPDPSIDEISDELEQALLISLIVTMTSHNAILAMVSEWEQPHQRFLQGHCEDPGHYLDVRTLKTTDAGGHGRVHMHRLASAFDAGTSIWMAGAARETVDNYPETQSFAYAQWFTYAFALWEEQFRGRIAAYFDKQSDTKIRHSDVLIPYFGDIRLIRNDFVHNKGICKESADTQVLTLGLRQRPAVRDYPQADDVSCRTVPSRRIAHCPNPTATRRSRAHIRQDRPSSPRGCHDARPRTRYQRQPTPRSSTHELASLKSPLTKFVVAPPV